MMMRDFSHLYDIVETCFLELAFSSKLTHIYWPC